MRYIELLYFILIIFIIVLIFLIFTYSSYSSKNIYNADGPNGLDIPATPTLTDINNSGILALVPTTANRSQKIKGKFIMQLSAPTTTDIYMRIMDKGEVIGDKTRYTIWDKDSFGYTQISIIFKSNQLSDGSSHNLTPQIATVGSAAGISLHSVYAYYY